MRVAHIQHIQEEAEPPDGQCNPVGNHITGICMIPSELLPNE